MPLGTDEVLVSGGRWRWGGAENEELSKADKESRSQEALGYSGGMGIDPATM